MTNMRNGLEGNTDIKGIGPAAVTKTKPVYKVPAELMQGVVCKQVLVNNIDDEEEVASVVETACKEVLGRTGSVDFPVLYNAQDGLQISSVKRGLKAAGATALVYHNLAVTIEYCALVKKTK